MPTLDQLLVSRTSDPTGIQFIDNMVVVEPLDGPTPVDSIMYRFPAEVYQQGRDSHLYRLLTALGGDSGAGLLKTQAYLARLRYEAEFLYFKILDQVYAAQFKFDRLRSETYSFNPETDSLTPSQWDQVYAADQRYKHRVGEFWNALRLGNTPDGMTMLAQAGSDMDIDLIEHYKYIFDTISDDKLLLDPFGTTLSTAEYVIIPRPTDVDQTYTRDINWEYVFTPPVTSGTIGNQIANTGFEAGAANWTAGTSCTIAQSSTVAQAGTKSLAITRNTTTGTAAAFTDEMPVLPSTSYTASYYVRSPTTARTAVCRISWYTSAHAFISSADSAGTTELTGFWTQVTETATSPSTAAYATVQAQTANAVATEVRYIDTVSFTNNVTRPPNLLTAASVAQIITSTSEDQLVPDIEHNTVNLLDRLRPVGALMSTTLDDPHYVPVSLNSQPAASSGRFEVNRLVTGQANVDWPTPDPNAGYFIEVGVEKIAGHRWQHSRSLPIVFHSAGQVKGYTEKALHDPKYDTADFFTDDPSPYDSAKSEHHGIPDKTFASIFPFLFQVSEDMVFGAENALARQDTPLIVEGT